MSEATLRYDPANAAKLTGIPEAMLRVSFEGGLESR